MYFKFSNYITYILYIHIIFIYIQVTVYYICVYRDSRELMNNIFYWIIIYEM